MKYKNGQLNEKKKKVEQQNKIQMVHHFPWCIDKHPFKSNQATTLNPNFKKKINLEKSVVVFSKNTFKETRDVVTNILSVLKTDTHVKYLGLPAVRGGQRKRFLQIFRFGRRSKVGKRNHYWRPEKGKFWVCTLCL